MPESRAVKVDRQAGMAGPGAVFENPDALIIEES